MNFKKSIAYQDILTEIEHTYSVDKYATFDRCTDSIYLFHYTDDNKNLVELSIIPRYGSIIAPFKVKLSQLLNIDAAYFKHAIYRKDKLIASREFKS